jgi:hypothetical protein
MVTFIADHLLVLQAQKIFSALQADNFLNVMNKEKRIA